MKHAKFGIGSSAVVVGYNESYVHAGIIKDIYLCEDGYVYVTMLKASDGETEIFPHGRYGDTFMTLEAALLKNISGLGLRCTYCHAPVETLSIVKHLGADCGRHSL